MDQEYQMVLLWCCIVLFSSLCRCLMNNKVWSSKSWRSPRLAWNRRKQVSPEAKKGHIGTTSFTYAGFYCPTNDPSPASPSPRVCSNDTCYISQNKILSRSKAAMPRQEASRRYAIFEKKSTCYDTKSPSDS